MDGGYEVKMLMSLATLELRFAEAIAKPSQLVGISHAHPGSGQAVTAELRQSAEARGCGEADPHSEHVHAQRCAGLFTYTVYSVSACLVGGWGVPRLRVPLEGFKACGSAVLCTVEELPCGINKLQFLT